VPHRLNLSFQSSRSCALPNIKVLKDKVLEFANSISPFSPSVRWIVKSPFFFACFYRKYLFRWVLSYRLHKGAFTTPICRGASFKMTHCRVMTSVLIFEAFPAGADIAAGSVPGVVNLVLLGTEFLQWQAAQLLSFWLLPDTCF
jgi:hypothetical protein